MAQEKPDRLSGGGAEQHNGAVRGGEGEERGRRGEGERGRRDLGYRTNKDTVYRTCVKIQCIEYI